MPDLTHPRQVKLKRCSIWSPTLHQRAPESIRADIARSGIDIAESVLSLDIYESIFQNTINARIRIQESHGFPEYFPLTGTEYVVISFETNFTPDDVNDTATFTRIFRVHRLHNQSFPKNEDRTYVIDLVTPEFFQSMSSRMTKRYTQTTCLDAVKDIMREQLNVNDAAMQHTMFEETSGSINIVIPNYTPLQAINFFTLMSMTKTTPHESNFVFYETLDGFAFTSIKKMIERGKQANPASLPTFTVNSNKLTGSPKVDARDAFNSIIKLHQEEVFDVLKDIATGMLRTKMLRIDFFGRTWEEEDSRYTESFKRTTHLDEFPCYPENFDQSVSRNVKLFIVPTNVSVAESAYVAKAGEEIVPQRMYESIVLRNRQLKEIQHLRTLLEVPGQAHIRAGTCVRVNYPSSRAIQGETDNLSVGGMPQSPTPYHSGLHLVTHVRHSMTQVALGSMEYTMHIEAVRDSLGSPLIGFPEDRADVDGSQV